MSRPALSETDLEWIAVVLFNCGNVGYEPSFSTEYNATRDAWDVVDVEGDVLRGYLSAADANACAAALNRLATRPW